MRNPPVSSKWTGGFFVRIQFIKILFRDSIIHFFLGHFDADAVGTVTLSVVSEIQNFIAGKDGIHIIPTIQEGVVHHGTGLFLCDVDPDRTITAAAHRILLDAKVNRVSLYAIKCIAGDRDPFNTAARDAMGS